MAHTKQRGSAAPAGSTNWKRDRAAATIQREALGRYAERILIVSVDPWYERACVATCATRLRFVVAGRTAGRVEIWSEAIDARCHPLEEPTSLAQ